MNFWRSNLEKFSGFLGGKIPEKFPGTSIN